MNTAKKLIQLRNEKGLTQAELGKELNIALSSIQNYENINKPRIPEAKLLLKIAKYYDVSMEYLLDDTLYNRKQENLQLERDFGLDDISIEVLKRLNEENLMDEFNMFLYNNVTDLFYAISLYKRLKKLKKRNIYKILHPVTQKINGKDNIVDYVYILEENTPIVKKYFANENFEYGVQYSIDLDKIIEKRSMLLDILIMYKEFIHSMHVFEYRNDSNDIYFLNFKILKESEYAEYLMKVKELINIIENNGNIHKSNITLQEILKFGVIKLNDITNFIDICELNINKLSKESLYEAEG